MERDRGAALVEMVIVTPLLALVAFGLLEWGLAYREALSYAHAARTGARAGVSAGPRPDADWEILQAVAGAVPSIDQVDAVIVYRADAADGSVPSECLSGGTLGVCNVYGPADLRLTRTEFTATGYTKDDDWSASARRAAAGNANLHLGVAVRASYQSTLGFGTRTHRISERAVMQYDALRSVSTTAPSSTSWPVTTTAGATRPPRPRPTTTSVPPDL